MMSPLGADPKISRSLQGADGRRPLTSKDLGMTKLAHCEDYTTNIHFVSSPAMRSATTVLMVAVLFIDQCRGSFQLQDC